MVGIHVDRRRGARETWSVCDSASKEIRTVLKRNCISGLVILGLAGSLAYSQEAVKDVVKTAAPPAAAGQETGKPADAKDVRNKLLPLTDMETAFKKAWATRVTLTRQVDDLAKKLKDATDEKQKEELLKNVNEARKNLQTLAIAMEVIFSTGLTRNYEFDEVKSTIFLRVGTAEEVFMRAVKARDLYGKVMTEHKAALEKEADAGKKKEMEKTLEVLTKRYQLVAAALQQVYGVLPTREFIYNPQNSTLYLKVSENEVGSIKEQLTKLQEERKARETAGQGAAAPPAAEGK